MVLKESFEPDVNFLILGRCSRDVVLLILDVDGHSLYVGVGVEEVFQDLTFVSWTIVGCCGDLRDRNVPSAKITSNQYVQPGHLDEYPSRGDSSSP